MSISPLAESIPPASNTLPPNAAVEAAIPPPPVTPKRGRPKKTTSPKKVASPTKAKTEVSAADDDDSSAASPSATAHVKFNDALKKAAVAMKMRGMATKAIAQALNVNYHTVWRHLKKTAKAKGNIGSPGGSAPEEMSDAEKKDAALALKLIGWSTKDIAETLDINYHTLWRHLDKYQKAADLPPVVHDPDM